jgi:hypothetical protein
MSDVNAALYTFAIIGGIWYVMPTLTAFLRLHPHAFGIMLLNLFFGWTLIGWIAAYTWANTKPHKVVMVAGADGAMYPVAAPSKPFRLENLTSELPWWGRIGLVAAPILALYLLSR